MIFRYYIKWNEKGEGGLNGNSIIDNEIFHKVVKGVEGLKMTEVGRRQHKKCKPKSEKYYTILINSQLVSRWK